MQEEVTQKTIALSMKTGKLTAQALQAALKKYLQHRAKGPKLHHGKQSLKQLKAHGAALTNIEVTEANIGAFKPCAKKYGVDFTLRKDKTTQPPHYIVIFKAKDADNGFPAQMDGHSLWAEEPADISRLTEDVPNRSKRMKTLGNAVSPPQVFPILKYIADIETGRCPMGGEEL